MSGTLNIPFSDGPIHVLLAPLDVMARLAALPQIQQAKNVRFWTKADLCMVVLQSRHTGPRLGLSQKVRRAERHQNSAVVH